MTVQEWLVMAEAILGDAGVETPRLDAQLLLAHHFEKTRAWLLAHLDEEVNDQDCEILLERRINREPLAYILGKVEFYGRDFRVDQSVLIPRQDTETLINAVLQRNFDQGVTVLDVGTGSGCIAISLKKERSDLNVIATDISAHALSIAQKNSVTLGADITFFKSDGIPNNLGVQVDVLVSNPPYISIDEELMPEVRNFEPAIALFAESQGLAMYIKLANQAQQSQIPWIFVEIGEGMEEPVTGIFREFHFDLIKSHKDLSGIIRVLQFDSRSLAGVRQAPRQRRELEWSDDFPETPPEGRLSGLVQTR